MKDIKGIKRILIRATNWIGDSIMSLPALVETKRNFPEAHISVLLRPWVKPIFESHPCVDEIIVYDKKRDKSRNLLELARIIRMLRNRQFDMAILFQNAFEAALIAFFSGIRIRLGLDTDGRRFLLSHPVKRRTHQHHVENYLDILRGIGIRTKETEPVLYIKDRHISEAEMILKECGIETDKPLIGLAPGAMYGPAKRWPARYFATIGDWAVKRWGAKVVIMGSRKEMDICANVNALMKEDAINLCGKTDLGVSMGIIKRCNMLVSNDSGLMHIAAALGVATIAIFGSTDPAATGPRGAHFRIIRHDIPCSPCFRRECPYDLQCLYSVTPDQVWKDMEDMWNETSSILGQGWHNK